jgi:hypothetical protein
MSRQEKIQTILENLHQVYHRYREDNHHELLKKQKTQLWLMDNSEINQILGTTNILIK